MHFATSGDDEVGRSIPSRHTDPATSHDGFKDVAPRAGSQRAKLLRQYAFPGTAFIPEEVAAAAGLSRSCFWKRCSELEQGGYIKPTGKVKVSSLGSNSHLCEITPKGTALLRSLKERP